MRLLDLFCGAGGASVGYARAGFDVVGVDIADQPRYPFRFIKGDALEYLRGYSKDYDVIHASPPCQGYSLLKYAPGRDMSNYPLLVSELRSLLIETGKPYVIENVPGAGLHSTVILCGTMFGLRVYRHRHFETSFMMFQPAHEKHTEIIKPAGSTNKLGVYLSKVGSMVTVAGNMFSLPAGRVAMGISWMSKKELAEAIPPAYTEYIGRFIPRSLT